MNDKHTHVLRPCSWHRDDCDFVTPSGKVAPRDLSRRVVHSGPRQAVRPPAAPRAA
jgi:hypothetical protein